MPSFISNIYCVKLLNDKFHTKCEKIALFHVKRTYRNSFHSIKKQSINLSEINYNNKWNSNEQ